MKAVINEKGELAIDMGEVMERLPDESKRTIAKYAVFEEVLLDGVIGALVDSAMWSSDDDGPWWHSTRTHERLRAKLLPLLPVVAAEAVRTIERDRRHTEASEKWYRDATRFLERRWPDRARLDEITAELKERRLDYPLFTREDAAKYLAEVEQRVLAEKPEIDRLKALLRTAVERGHRLAGLECSAEDEDAFEAIAKEAGLDMTFPTEVVSG